ncbi:fumarylacetoacetate hydrolase family protein [Microbacterium sp. 18062]|uniref:fumarylacetoacetate hydrolase family protein n=1 Tax=Microbacterium sp. 18062 TaxID=2681410 RepID=UPI00135A369B|nr:fumarylacetoacetate hydrolase family protein [Microbacterium sp. 18062]
MRIGAAEVDGARRTVLIERESSLVLPAGAPDADDYVRDQAVGTVLAAADGAVRVPTADLRLRAPLRRVNRDVLCTGWNYWSHFEESAGKREGQDPAERPTHPTFFTKGPGTIAGPYDDIVLDPELSTKWDYEVELALVIGRGGRSIPAERAADHIAGYLIANDVSQRDLQRAHGGQWLKGKSIDGSLPLGPWLTTIDEVADASGLRLEFELNGRLLQDAGVAQMAFDIPTLIAELSRGMTLQAGDVLLTGTPAGIGNAREPQVFLKPGDMLVSRVSGLGELRNTVVAGSLTDYLPL